MLKTMRNIQVPYLKILLGRSWDVVDHRQEEGSMSESNKCKFGMIARNIIQKTTHNQPLNKTVFGQLRKVNLSGDNYQRFFII